jgi:hypothetical protein
VPAPSCRFVGHRFELGQRLDVDQAADLSAVVQHHRHLPPATAAFATMDGDHVAIIDATRAFACVDQHAPECSGARHDNPEAFNAYVDEKVAFVAWWQSSVTPGESPGTNQYPPQKPPKPLGSPSPRGQGRH